MYIILLLVLLIFGNVIRCGTFRLAHGGLDMSHMVGDRLMVGKLLSPYDHRETDELVYDVSGKL